ncbi:hypothetical protein SEVCU121_0538 [Staphylococcus warneri VCU121]|nr:hypothetical protein SEVCU121_0538 [Staphylococcus warneri VCU121]
MSPFIVISPSIINMMMFIITAQTPYFTSVTKASASIIDDDRLNNNKPIAIDKNNEAVGLSGTNGKK